MFCFSGYFTGTFSMLYEKNTEWNVMHSSCSIWNVLNTIIEWLWKKYESCGSHIQGSPHLQKIGRLDFSLRADEGEVKAWQGDFQQLHRDMFPQKCGVFSHHFFLYLHLKCALANILLTLCSCFVFVLLVLLSYICWFKFFK